MRRGPELGRPAARTSQRQVREEQTGGERVRGGREEGRRPERVAAEGGKERASD
jgi:hypothetical protein